MYEYIDTHICIYIYICPVTNLESSVPSLLTSLALESHDSQPLLTMRHVIGLARAHPNCAHPNCNVATCCLSRMLRLQVLVEDKAAEQEKVLVEAPPWLWPHVQTFCSLRVLYFGCQSLLAQPVVAWFGPPTTQSF